MPELFPIQHSTECVNTVIECKSIEDGFHRFERFSQFALGDNIYFLRLSKVKLTVRCLVGYRI